MWFMGDVGWFEGVGIECIYLLLYVIVGWFKRFLKLMNIIRN